MSKSTKIALARFDDDSDNRSFDALLNCVDLRRFEQHLGYFAAVDSVHLKIQLPLAGRKIRCAYLKPVCEHYLLTY